jgi:hypothetical protein
MTNSTDLNVALKEWNATTAALEAGRQILLLRKGGLLDPAGKFELEHSQFWLVGNRFHEDTNQVKAEDVAYLSAFSAERGSIRVNSLAEVVKTWSISLEEVDKLKQLEHIWSDFWIDTRFDYQPENPLLVVAVRVSTLPKAQVLEMRPEYGGCKSWIELETSFSTEATIPVLDNEAFDIKLAAAEHVLGA